MEPVGVESMDPVGVVSSTIGALPLLCIPGSISPISACAANGAERPTSRTEYFNSVAFMTASFLADEYQDRPEAVGLLNVGREVHVGVMKFKNAAIKNRYSRNPPAIRISAAIR